MNKKLISLLLAIVMVCTLLPLTALAAEEASVTFRHNNMTSGKKVLTAENGAIAAPTAKEVSTMGRPITNGSKTLLGWDADPNAVYPTYLIGDTIEVDGDVTLYGIWARMPANGKVTVTYVHNNYTSGKKVVKTYVNSAKDVVMTALDTKGASTMVGGTLTFTPYNFLGWAETADATEPTILPGDVFYAFSDVTLYAVWDK